MSANYAESRIAAPGAARTVQVTERLNQVETLIDEGLKLQSELESRLPSVLRSEPEIGEVGGSDQKEKSIVPLAERIDGLARTLRRLNGGYTSMMRRLEV